MLLLFFELSKGACRGLIIFISSHTFPSAINPVTTISFSYNCSSGMVTVTWDLVFGANLYRATVVDRRDQSLNCTSASTSCQITQLNCGEKYQVHVTAISDDCSNTSVASAILETGERMKSTKKQGLYLSLSPFSTCALSVLYHLSVYVLHMYAHTHVTPLDKNSNLSSFSLTLPIRLSCGRLFRFLPWCPMLFSHAEQWYTPSN